MENTNSVPTKFNLSKLMLADSRLCPSSLSHLTEGKGTPNATHVRTRLELWLASTVEFGVRKNTGTYSERWRVREIDKTNLENHNKKHNNLTNSEDGRLLNRWKQWQLCTALPCTHNLRHYSVLLPRLSECSQLVFHR